jgi:hypothetical protein
MKTQRLALALTIINLGLIIFSAGTNRDVLWLTRLRQC